jgi:hypothetical protein
VLGEIIEHVDNCGTFLNSIKKFTKPGTQVILTTPNNYYYLFWLYTIAGWESINPDHNYLFSYNSMRILLGKFGFKINDNFVVWDKIDFTRVDDTPGQRFKKRLMAFMLNGFHLFKHIFPQYGKGMIVIAVPES